MVRFGVSNREAKPCAVRAVELEVDRGRLPALQILHRDNAVRIFSHEPRGGLDGDLFSVAISGWCFSDRRHFCQSCPSWQSAIRERINAPDRPRRSRA
jgi:hypothetical protein